ncbi:Mechanosensitive channel MscK precursor [Mariniflexile rhizosphaerae]|uniref:mechanosensitive ion channel family protein n=1 Tax=unclassified Mariniflexile TaxID=2643887 RepID=UPI000CB6BDF3|nr:mechanosensitive ion channel domain-containing protein [Mariniflexile sp. TRM1-10]AXP81872.1 Mechanosensitive channel MscK precursor [Mariniflexile sp. TRM1-10]PLB20740.1 MAG: Potassium efflux system KefA protein [Flavobacteriaceae bacterium FS1-H7996/R]
MTQEFKMIAAAVAKSSFWNDIKAFLNKHFDFSESISISVKDILIIITVIFITTFVLRIVLRIITRKLPEDDKGKFNVVFGYFRWLIYLLILLVTLHGVGVDVTAVFAASAALMIGIGLALQTLFQDIISGVFILIDQTVHVGDIIELEGKIGRVEEIKLRTTRAVTIDNKVLIIPNHLYLENSLYNWTQNGFDTRESVEVGVAYGSDVQLVKKLLIEAAAVNKDVLYKDDIAVRFTNFGDSSLDFKVIFTISDSFNANAIRSDVRFEIDRLFRENNISIPFPQRDIHIIQKPDQSVSLRLDQSEFNTNLSKD